MPYVSRTPDGEIEAVFDRPGPNAREEIAQDAAELQKFIAQSHTREHAKRLLEESDQGVIRVVEDLIWVLLEKNVLVLTDLPLAVREKLSSRRAAREELHSGGCPILHKEDNKI